MNYRHFGASDISLSAIGLGGHEYLPDGSSRGFNEHRGEAVKPGYKGEGYGGPQRVELIERALAAGVNFFDVTIDPEKEALGRNLRQVSLPHDVYIQTRPEGMAYGYDPGNRKMGDAGLLRAEVERCLNLLQRDTIDILNFPFLQSALDGDPDYLSKISDNISALKDADLIRFASADNFSGESTYLSQIESDIFDSISINFSFANASPADKVLPAAAEAGMGVITREVFLKGNLFEMGKEVGETDQSRLARIALKWNLSVPQVTTTLVGARNIDQFENALSLLDTPELTADESTIVSDLLATPTGKSYSESRRSAFLT
jgi:aryl-alcohol dehydrogenase-like predicted oxidoreductase